MYINFLHILKWSKSFMIRPSKTIKWFLDDFKKDTNSSNFKSKYHNVWCAGLPTLFAQHQRQGKNLMQII